MIYNMKKIYCIAGIVIMTAYTVIGIMVSEVSISIIQLMPILANMFFLISCGLSICNKNSRLHKTFSVIFIAISLIIFIIMLRLRTNMFATATIMIMYIAFVIIDDKASASLLGISRGIFMVITIALSISLFNEVRSSDEHPLIFVSTHLMCCQIAIAALAEKLGKAKKIIIPISFGLYIMPILYLIRGYWGITERWVLPLISISSLVIALACTVITNILEFKSACKARKLEKLAKKTAPVPTAAAVNTVAPSAVNTAASPAINTAAPSAINTAASPVINTAAPVISNDSGQWTCPNCGKTDNKDMFCEECGAKKPQPESSVWTCPACGAAANTGKFCGKCGNVRPKT